MPEIVATFDRYDITEAYFLLSVRWGLYGIGNRLHHMHFKPSPIIGYATLTDNAQAIYNEIDRRLYQALYNERRDLRGLDTARSLKGYDLT